MARSTSLAIDFFNLARTDRTFEKTLRDNYRSMVEGLADGSEVLEIFMGSKNGANYQGRITVSADDRRIAMRLAIQMLDGRATDGSRGRLSF